MSQKFNFQTFRLLILNSILEKKWTLTKIVGALLLLSVSQGLFVLMTGPLFKSMLGAVEKPEIRLLDLVPAQAAHYLSFLSDIVLPQATVIHYLPLSILFVGILQALAGFFYQYNQQALTLYVGSRYREKLFAAILKQPLDRLLLRSAGEWMSLVMNDVSYLQSRMSDLLTGLVKDSVQVLSSLAALYFIHWPTGVLLTILSLPLMMMTGRTGKKIAHYAAGWQKNLAKMASAVLEMRKRFEFIRAQGGERAELERFQTLNQGYYRNIVRSILIRSAFAPGLELLGFLMLASVILALGRGYMGQDLVKAGELLQFLLILGTIIRPLRSIGEQIASLHETRGIVQRSLETFSSVEEFQTANIPAILRPVPSLTIDELTVSYGEGFRLDAMAIHVEAGQSVAIIGPSGGGKSTFLKCLGGLYAPSMWAGAPSWAIIRDNSCLVSQKPFLFSGSIRDNLNYGIEAQADSKLQEALSFVSLSQELEMKGQSLDTELDFLQSPLSGGQMQRMTIARGFLRPHSLLLMDEITSAIDPAAEEMITKRVVERARLEKRILLYVTHRLSQLETFDQVWFCESGKVTVFKEAKEWQKSIRVQRFLDSESHA